MGTTWQSLVWKEWHEHKWKLASITAVLMGATTLSILASEPQDKFGLAFGMMFMCVIPLAVFVGLGAAANEQSRGTLAYLQAQPVPPWHVGLVKLILSLLTVIVPVILTVLSIIAWRWSFDLLGVDCSDRGLQGSTGGINTGNFFVDIAIFSALLGVSLVIWTAAAGVNRKDEISAGALALAIILGWIAIVWTLSWLVYKAGLDLDQWGVAAVLSVLPGFVAVFGPEFTAAQIAFGAFTTTIVHLLLAALYVRRFGQTMERAVVSPKVAMRDTRRIDWLDSPRRSPLTSVVWKQFRESVPIAVAGLAGIVGTATVVYAVDRSDYPTPPTRFAEMYFTVSISLGFCIALVVGIGVALQDMGPQLNTFWRSRPINGSLWFWTKFVTGLLVVVGAIYGPQLFLSTSAGYLERDHAEVVSGVATLHIATYAAAVAMTCLIRHAVYAAILSMGALTASITAAWVVWMLPSWFGSMTASEENNFFFGESIEFPAMMTGLIACFVISTVIGWLSMGNDWGWKSRY